MLDLRKQILISFILDVKIECVVVLVVLFVLNRWIDERINGIVSGYVFPLF